MKIFTNSLAVPGLFFLCPQEYSLCRMRKGVVLEREYAASYKRLWMQALKLNVGPICEMTK
jgi:hypothetical protein